MSILRSPSGRGSSQPHLSILNTETTDIQYITFRTKKKHPEHDCISCEQFADFRKEMTSILRDFVESQNKILASLVATNEKIDKFEANIEVLNIKSDNKSIAIDLSCDEIFSELQERYLREKNLTIVGVPEAKGENSKQRSASNTGEVLKVIKITFPECPDPIQVRRIGKYSP
ncbi:unnamed protein product [Parnassius apollo]|uniref:(apollo) hypothetical protein n=1 Tax=Parnassius apollo TaxID=110799 RepID=A0A8S3XHX1_PARAO|nr:unnamed protein product [Parnassius apollo]